MDFTVLLRKKRFDKIQPFSSLTTYFPYGTPMLNCPNEPEEKETKTTSEQTKFSAACSGRAQDVSPAYSGHSERFCKFLESSGRCQDTESDSGSKKQAIRSWGGSVKTLRIA